ncbi:MAG: hypothetical protein JSS66_11295 [Armatimonadetes bacterium]|nr:hypothetical protein [Armatimonadota bacterium]
MQRDRRHHRSGQTLVIAVIILGVLIILGLAFAGIISRNITQASKGQRTNLATDLARAGAEYAHYQLRYSLLGADWRPSPTPPNGIDVNGFTKDPDALYLRPAHLTLPFSNDPRLANVPDLGGPDGYGPYSRVFFDRGRALVRIRYAPEAMESYASPNGQLLDPGKMRNYLTIDVVGRPGPLLQGSRVDPSLQLPESVKVTNYANITEKTSEIARLKSLDNTLLGTRKLMAFTSIGMLEAAHYIHNKDRVSRPAEIGCPTPPANNAGNPTPWDKVGTGANYGDAQAPFANNPDDVRPVFERTVLGSVYAEPNSGRGNNWSTIPGFGSLYCNADLTIYGEHLVSLNSSLGEGFDVSGHTTAANNQSALLVSRTYYDRVGDLWRSDLGANASTVNNPVLLQGPLLDSDQSVFTTVGGVVRDGFSSPDAEGYPRGIPRKEPGLIQTVDPQNKQNRYLVQTRESGVVVNGANTGRFGLGRGVYVDSIERGNTNSEDERIVSSAVKALMSDWLNPNNPASQGWKGPYYIPLATSIRLLPDGFEITRDIRSRTAFWRNPNGTSTGKTKAKFRVRTVEYPLGSGKFQPMILNSVVNGNLVGRPGATLTDDDFRQFGQLFNGVIFCEGDVRVRGVIPTDQQLTLVSMGSTYVDGSITKGVVNELTGQVINRPSRSAFAVLTRDYAVLNTTMFFGPAPGENVDEKNENSVPDTPNPFELKLEDPDIQLETEFLLDPATPASLGGNPVNPSTWRPYASSYVAAGSNTPMNADILINSSADDNGPAFVSMDVLPTSYALLGTWSPYLFPRSFTFGLVNETFNAAAGYFTGIGNIPVYGLGNPTINAYPKFEAIEFAIANGTFNYNGRQLVPANGALGNYSLAVQDPTLFRVRMNGVGQAPMKNFLASRTAIAPHDVRIEAALYAEEGCYFVIPGNWFNGNSQDSRRNWLDRTAASIYAGMTDDQANQRRFELFGHTPSVPFYAEPLDVKVSILGSVSENMPAPISAQAEWMKKWGWIPRQLGSTGLRIPTSHLSGNDPNLVPAIPNLIVTHDPMLVNGGVWDPGANTIIPVRTDENGSVLPPMPRLPVSPTLAYYGEVNP